MSHINTTLLKACQDAQYFRRRREQASNIITRTFWTLLLDSAEAQRDRVLASRGRVL